MPGSEQANVRCYGWSTQTRGGGECPHFEGEGKRRLPRWRSGGRAILVGNWLIRGAFASSPVDPIDFPMETPQYIRLVRGSLAMDVCQEILSKLRCIPAAGVALEDGQSAVGFESGGSSASLSELHGGREQRAPKRRRGAVTPRRPTPEGVGSDMEKERGWR